MFLLGMNETYYKWIYEAVVLKYKTNGENILYNI